MVNLGGTSLRLWEGRGLLLRRHARRRLRGVPPNVNMHFDHQFAAVYSGVFTTANFDGDFFRNGVEGYGTTR